MRSMRLDRRRFLELVAGAAAGTALAGCGPTATLEPTTAAVVEEPGEVEIEFWDWDHEPRVLFTEQLVAEFMEQNPNIIVKYNPLGWTDIETKLLTTATAGSGPSFSNVHYFWRYDLQRAGILAPYPDDMFDWSGLLSTPFNRDPDSGSIYTSDFCFYCDMVFYNHDMLDAEGIKPEDIPKNWDDFIAMSQQLTKTDSSGKITQVGCSLNDYWAREWLWHTLVYQQGAFLYNEDGTEALWNEEAGVRALQFMQDWYHKLKIDDPEFLAHYDGFGNEKAAMFIDQGYMAAGINDSFPQLEGRWATVETPTFTGTPDPSWGMALPEEGFCVFNTFDADVIDAAFKYIKFMLGSEERRIEWALLMDGPPDEISLLSNPEIDEGDEGRVIASQANTMEWRVIYGERPLEAEKFWRTMFDEAILENKDVKASLDSATEQMNAALKESGKKRYIVERAYEPPAS